MTRPFHPFGPQASAAAQKEGDRAEAGRPIGEHMLNVATAERTNKQAPLKDFADLQPASAERRAEAWLDVEVQRAKGTVTTQVVQLTPALAQVLLRRNAGNRPIGKDKITQYARDIANDAWPLNGEPVIVANDGSLNDGQHRCFAVIAAGRSIDVVFVVGPERDTRLTLDQGKGRTVGDFLGMEGHINANALAALGGYAWQYFKSGTISHMHMHRPSKGEVLAFINDNPDTVESLAAVPVKGSNVFGGRSLLGFCHYVFTKAAGRDEADAFIASFLEGANLQDRDPILYARNRLMADRRMRPPERAELIFRAWNAHRRHERPKTLPVLGGALPAVEG